jgi:protein involved in polysaccharide export with SLBB domain
MAELNAELAKRGMTEADARKMAKIYGIDYDEYIKKYISSENLFEKKPSSEFGNTLLDTTVSELHYLFGEEELEDLEELPLDSLPIEDTLTGLPYFGYDIFENNPFANKDYLIGNIDENYILGPGDEIRIYVWGSHAYQAQVRIDLNGNIALPDNGVFFASGYTFATLKKKLRSYLGKSYSGLTTSPQTSFIDVSLTQLRPVSITVLGESNTPGPHLVNGLATVLNALYAAGGIKTTGSLREIKVYRNNTLLKTVDLYDYITNGALDKDIRLMNNDVIFIPTRQSSISLTGAVQKIAVFELKDGEGLNELIDYAGGLYANASIKNISINRITPFEDRSEEQTYNRYLSSVNWGLLQAEKKNYTLFDGDSIAVQNILDRVLNQATVTGSVNRPGTYSTSAYPDLRSLIVSAAEGVLPRTHMNKVDLYRTDTKGGKSFESFHLAEVLEGNQNINLFDDDTVVVYSQNEIEGAEPWIEFYSFMKDSTQVGDSIQLAWSENLSLYDLIFSLSPVEDPDFKRQVLQSRIDVKRYNPKSGMYVIQSYNFQEVMQRKETVALMPRDQVHLYSREVNEIVNQKVFIKGYVNVPGEYVLTENMTVEDLILQAGGFQEFSDQETVIITSPEYDVDNGQISRSREVKLDPDYLLGKKKMKKEGVFYLKHLDVVNVRQIPGYEEMKSITVSGEVRYPGVVTLTNKKQSLNEVLKVVGGTTPFASFDASYILREDKRFIIDVKKVLKQNLSFLKDGDEIVIGTNTGEVSVQGAVLNEGLFVWEEGSRLSKYLNNSGGYDGKIASVVVELPSGIAKRKHWYNNPKVLPNSKIYVYAKPEKEKKEGAQIIKEFSGLFSVITGTLTTILMIQQLTK